ncbi:phytochelatin synthase family protein [Mesorhizobium sp. WSM2239]|uniref:glutathione gamma-glutamylcysteinyltransferase n=2 Tax=unclassified Mesorhizobium TaxID=325217 RepID=A0AAU8DG21_9HYPH
MIRHRVFGVIGGLGLLAVVALNAGGPSNVPEEAIQSSVIRIPELIDRAWQLPVATTFKPNVSWQSNGSRCGPASLANAFRSIGEEEITEGEVLDGTGLCSTGFCIMGLTLDELAEVARGHTHRNVSVVRDMTADEFREHMKRANHPGSRYIVNFSRERIFGAGVGHHSPIGGYLEDEDLVFVLDVNEDFGPWLIEADRLYSAVDTIDGDKKRGLLLIK